MTISYNHETKQALRLDESGQWIETQTATNPQTGETLAFNGKDWEPIKAQERGLGEEALRKAEFGARGFADSAIETIGAVPDLVAAGLRKAGMDLPEGDYHTEALKEGWQALRGMQPQAVQDISAEVMGGEMSTADKAAYGTGRGVADAGSIMAPAAALSKYSKAANTAKGAAATHGGTMTERVATTLAASPKMQAAAGATGGAVGEATENPWLGLAASIATPVAAYAGRKVLSPMPNRLSPKELKTVKMGEDMGIEWTAGQKSGSKMLQTTENSLAELPFSAGKQQKIYDTQRGTINRSILRKAGIDEDSLTPERLGQAYDELGGVYDDLAKQIELVVDDKFFTQVGKVQAKYKKDLPSNVRPIIDSYVDDVLEMAAAAETPGANRILIEGRAFQRVVSSIKTRARRAHNDPDLQHALNGMIQSFESMMARSAPKEVSAKWRATNRLYRNLKIIDDAVAGGDKAARSSGDIPVQGLKASVKKSDPKGFSRGRSEFSDDLRVAEFASDKIPNSGTARRSRVMDMLTGATPITAGGVSSMMGASPGAAVAAGAGTLALPPIAQMILANPAVKKALLNQVAAGNLPRIGSPAALAQLKDMAIAPDTALESLLPLHEMINAK